MTYYDAYVTLQRPGADAENLSAERTGKVSPMFPEGGEAFFALKHNIIAGEIDGFQVDWGSWAARMTRSEISRFLAEVFGPPGDYERRHDGGLQHLADQMRYLRAFVAQLAKDEEFWVVIEEF